MLRDDLSKSRAHRAATAGTDAIVNCSVVRTEIDLAFDVNVSGTYYALCAAVANGQRRFINTGPHFAVVGQSYEVRC